MRHYLWKKVQGSPMPVAQIQHYAMFKMSSAELFPHEAALPLDGTVVPAKVLVGPLVPCR